MVVLLFFQYLRKQWLKNICVCGNLLVETAAAGASGQYWIRKVWETRHVHLELKVTVLDYKLMSDVRGKGGGRKVRALMGW